ncbi:hypothetical protein C4H11_09600 [Bacteroides zoogleoformans]|uniref:Uncharacterized protein n=1 Tax=Bacteroides zoogleoformans TaxID=28119 RepID=A0ABM6T8K6_9BACE|nr:hypothetical protein C4H11_09600 [Bacteroides zoogleoformans]
MRCKSKRNSPNLQHSVGRYCYGSIKEFLLQKNFFNRVFLLKESITFVGEKQGLVKKQSKKSGLFMLFFPCMLLR